MIDRFRAPAFLICAVLLAGCATTSTDEPPVVAHATYASAAVAADHEIASRAGAEILAAGGNAVDAAVAASFTLSVVRPHSCGIGGGGFMLVFLRPEPGERPVMRAINYREMAPGAADASYFERKPAGASERGGAAVGVPGSVAGLLHALEQYGTMDRAAALAPAIRAARDGFLADRSFVANSQGIIEWYREAPERQRRYPFVWNRYLRRGAVAVGDRIRVPEQARVLSLIADQGAPGFYEGVVGEAIVASIGATGGDMTLDDLRAYRVDDTEPLVGVFAGRTLLTMPPPSSGGVATLQALTILERIGALDALEHNDPEYAHRLVEAFKHAFADRARWLGDPAFGDVPVDDLLSSSYLESRAAMFNPRRTLSQSEYGQSEPIPDDSGTSHLSVIDADGNAVACTETINLVFGSMVSVERFGFVLNDEMDDFLARRNTVNAFGLRQSELNLPAPGKRPLSSMSPVIVLDGPDTSSAGVEVIAGASGGPRIITGTMQAVLNVLLFDMPAWEAISSPRLHHQWSPDAVYLEPGLRGTAADEGLRSRGHEVRDRKGVGVVQLIRRTNENGRRVWGAACDPRKGGRPAGY